MIETEKQPALMMETAKLRHEPLVINPALEEIKICIWNKVCDPKPIPQPEPDQRIQPGICDPCSDSMLKEIRRKRT